MRSLGCNVEVWAADSLPPADMRATLLSACELAQGAIEDTEQEERAATAVRQHCATRLVVLTEELCECAQLGASELRLEETARRDAMVTSFFLCFETLVRSEHSASEGTARSALCTLRTAADRLVQLRGVERVARLRLTRACLLINMDVFDALRADLNTAMTQRGQIASLLNVTVCAEVEEAARGEAEGGREGDSANGAPDVVLAESCSRAGVCKEERTERTAIRRDAVLFREGVPFPR